MTTYISMEMAIKVLRIALINSKTEEERRRIREAIERMSRIVYGEEPIEQKAGGSL